MVSSRKRALRDVESDEVIREPLVEPDLLYRVRNSWQFANLFQWIYLFGRVVKIDENIDIAVRWVQPPYPTDQTLIKTQFRILKLNALSHNPPSSST
jgi:hypothetical protein